MNVNNTGQPKDRHFLIAVDESESSKRAVLYVADIVGGFPGFAVTLLSIIPEPEKDFFDSEEERAAWAKGKLDAANRLLNNYQEIMVQAGFPPEKVRIRSCVGEGRSMSEAILDTRCDLSCCTVVVGRHHKSKAEEFLLGSTSTRLIREAKNCAVWVVE
jgi:nucleotide-binding universal stress UspA family protein